MLYELKELATRVEDLDATAARVSAAKEQGDGELRRAELEDESLAYRAALLDAARDVRDAAQEPTNVQGLALSRLMRDRPNVAVTITRRPFDLPEGYWLVVFDSDPRFECGIAPDGSVSS